MKSYSKITIFMAVSASQVETRTRTFSSHLYSAVEAKDLAAKDLNGFSDPYVVFKVEDQRETTKSKRKTLNPQWNESFHLYVCESILSFVSSDICYPSTIITVKVMDHDLTTKDDLIEEF